MQGVPVNFPNLEGTDFSKDRTAYVYGTTMNEYQKEATKTAVFEDAYYPFASLMIEAAEFADIVTKPWLRNDNVKPNRKELISEAGDVLWNLANALDMVNISLQEVADYNIAKLKDRAERGVIKGSGGTR